jgi:Rab-3A-interacting protein
LIFKFDPIYFKELVEWRESPEVRMKGSFMERIYKEDVLPCLNFSDRKMSEELLNAIETNSVSIEELTNSQQCAEAMIQ